MFGGCRGADGLGVGVPGGCRETAAASREVARGRRGWTVDEVGVCEIFRSQIGRHDEEGGVHVPAEEQQ